MFCHKKAATNLLSLHEFAAKLVRSSNFRGIFSAIIISKVWFTNIIVANKCVNHDCIFSDVSKQHLKDKREKRRKCKPGVAFNFSIHN